jgi:hypothetical protein
MSRNPKSLARGLCQADTPAFKEWFGDSKVVNARFEPLVVFHGTGADFARFGLGRGAIYFTSDPSVASEYACQADVDDGDPAPCVMPVYLSIKNPLTFDEAWAQENLDFDGDRDWTTLDNVLYEAADAGHDGVILRGVVDYAGMDANGKRLEKAYDQFIAFRPSQIKSAIGNLGSFAAGNTEIRCSSAASYRERVL